MTSGVRASERHAGDWHIRDIAPEVENLAKGAAIISGKTLGQWLSEAIREKFDREMRRRGDGRGG